MTPDKQTFIDWLKLNRLTLADKSTDEICYFARLNGFDMAVVYEVLSHYAMDRLQRNTYQLREDWHVDRELKEVTNQARPYLAECWYALGQHLTTGRYFND